jgi:UDP:flavonoid glycosyltransferase YjiC (YdhE family)
MGQRVLPDYALAVDYAPYGWLFPRMAAVVHHGGSGTTGWGLRAGVPSLVVPFLFDQFYWGRRIATLGVGPEPIPFKKLTAGRLATAIRTAVDDDGLRRCAAALGAKIAAEHGLSTAVELIHSISLPGARVSEDQYVQIS